MRSSCTTAYQPIENGRAEPQSIARKRIQLSGIGNGSSTCLAVDHSSKNAPSMIDQSPSSQALTSCGEPTALSLLMYWGSCSNSDGLSVSLAGMKTRDSLVSSSRMTFQAP